MGGGGGEGGSISSSRSISTTSKIYEKKKSKLHKIQVVGAIINMSGMQGLNKKE